MAGIGLTEEKVRADGGDGLQFEVSFPSQVHYQPITGRAYVIISRHANRPPYLQTGVTGAPIWGKNIYALKPGAAAVIDRSVYGYPLPSIKDIPPGEYYVQGFINIYTEFKRSDGHTLWLHNDQWEGQRWNRSPGNIYSEVRKVNLNPSETTTVKLRCLNVIPPVDVPPDTKWVKRLKFQSNILTNFWGKPIYLGATILLPKGYDEHPDVYYPVNYIQGHFSLGSPHGFRPPQEGPEAQRGRGGGGFSPFWLSENCPRMIAVTFQHPCPYYDDSYAVNSANVGPYGDALLQELIPYVEEHFRIIREPYARTLSGGSTGGWESLALQIFHPDFFGGVWSLCSDPVDFNCYQIVNIYQDKNAYYREFEWFKIERPNNRSTDGKINSFMKDENHYELVLGDKSRSSGQWDIWEAVYSPIGEDGYPKRIWNKLTGEIDPEVAQYWRENYDLNYYLQKNWSWLGPKLVGKLHIYTGDMDSYYLNNAVVLMERFLESTKEPYYAGVVEYGDRQPHCWGPRGEELIKLMTEHITKNAPAGADTSTWKYK
ncbi:MAG: hypothetical protein AMJ79_12505 [Phycisphaerae bacterium SM23_30]|nr:MAG: hypothetical protein AMJ79_12505 [Phycisphaerae bacterium SM23_30]